jgi:hypothetical protein
MKGVAPLIAGVDFDALLADKAFDADWLLAELDQRGTVAVIPTAGTSDSIVILRFFAGVIQGPGSQED